MPIVKLFKDVVKDCQFEVNHTSDNYCMFSVEDTERSIAINVELNEDDILELISELQFIKSQMLQNELH